MVLFSPAPAPAPLPLKLNLLVVGYAAAPAPLSAAPLELISNLRIRRMLRGGGAGGGAIEMRMSARASGRSSNRSNNRMPLQRGRNLSVEAIQAVQALKREYLRSQRRNSKDSDSDSDSDSHSDSSLKDHILDSKFSRLLKVDMMAVLRELLRQNHSLLALRVFEHVRKEDWYRPQLSLYTDIITAMASNGLPDQVQLVYSYLKTESPRLQPDNPGFNALLRAFFTFHLTTLVMDCYHFMTTLGFEPDRPTLRILVQGLESLGESGASAFLRQDAQKYYGQCLDFLEDEDESAMIQNSGGTSNQLVIS